MRSRPTRRSWPAAPPLMFIAAVFGRTRFKYGLRGVSVRAARGGPRRPERPARRHRLRPAAQCRSAATTTAADRRVPRPRRRQRVDALHGRGRARCADAWSSVFLLRGRSWAAMRLRRRWPGGRVRPAARRGLIVGRAALALRSALSSASRAPAAFEELALARGRLLAGLALALGWFGRGSSPPTSAGICRLRMPGHARPSMCRPPLHRLRVRRRLPVRRPRRRDARARDLQRPRRLGRPGERRRI